MAVKSSLGGNMLPSGKDPKGESAGKSSYLSFLKSAAEVEAAAAGILGFDGKEKFAKIDGVVDQLYIKPDSGSGAKGSSLSAKGTASASTGVVDVVVGAVLENLGDILDAGGRKDEGSAPDREAMPKIERQASEHSEGLNAFIVLPFADDPEGFAVDSMEFPLAKANNLEGFTAEKRRQRMEKVLHESEKNNFALKYFKKYSSLKYLKKYRSVDVPSSVDFLDMLDEPASYINLAKRDIICLKDSAEQNPGLSRREGAQAENLAESVSNGGNVTIEALTESKSSFFQKHPDFVPNLFFTIFTGGLYLVVLAILKIAESAEMQSKSENAETGQAPRFISVC